MSPQPKWAHLLKAYRRENPRTAGRLDLHNILRVSPHDMGLAVFPQENEYARPKKGRSEDLFIFGSNTGEKTTIEIYLKRRPLTSASGQSDPPQDTVEVNLTLCDEKGDIYTLQETTTVPFSDTEYRAAGFAYEPLQGNKIGRIKYRGYLKRNGDSQKLVYVKIRFLCLYFSKIYDHQRFFDDGLLVQELKNAREAVESMADLLEDKLEQFCQIKGTFTVESDEERELFFLGTVGRRFLPEKLLPPRNVLKICGFDVQGTGFQLGLVSQADAHYCYGFISKRGENFRVLKKMIDLTKDQFTKLVKAPEQSVEFEVIFEGSKKVSYKIAILPHKGHVRLVKINGVDGMCFVDERLFEETDTKRPSTSNEIQDTLVVDLTEDCAKQVELTGGKGASLAQLKKLSASTDQWSVPNAVVVTTSAYKVQTQTMEHFAEKLKQLQSDVIRGEGVEKKCTEFVQWFSGQPLHERVKEQLKQKLERQFGTNWETILFAIRSSAASEDSDEMSTAGQMTTYLGLNGLDRIARAVVACWASQFAYAPVQYKRSYGQPIDSPMAVVVQEMINCSSAGVVFTANPIDGDERLLTVTSNFGLGESVVSAAAEPDTFTLAVGIEANSYQVKRSISSISSKVIGKKSLVTRLSSKVGEELEDGVRNEVNYDATEVQSLEDEELIRLGSIALEIAAHYGNPRDIEWGLLQGSTSDANQLFIFQSRPITNLDTHFTDYELMHEYDAPHLSEDEIYTRAHYGEILPGATTWMGIFYMTTEYMFTFGQVQMGTATPLDYNPYRPVMTGFFYNQIMTSLRNPSSLMMFSEYPDSNVSSALVMALFGHQITDPDVLEAFRRGREEQKQQKKKKPSMPIGKRLAMAGMLWDWFFGMEKIIKRLKEEVILGNRGNIVPQIDGRPLVERVDLILKQLVTFFERDSMYHAGTLFGSTLKSMFLMKALKHAGADDSALHHDHNLLLSSCVDVVSAEIPNRLREIAKAIEDKDGFAILSDEEALGVLRGDRGTEAKAVELFADFLKWHGHRGHREGDLMYQPMGHNPIPAVQVVKSLLIGNSNLDAKPTKPVDELLGEIQTPLTGFERWLIKRWLLPMCRNAVGFRENTKSVMMKWQNFLRQALWNVAEAMHQAGMLPEAELFFYLKFDEIMAMIEGWGSPVLVWKAQQRRRLRPTMDALRFDEFLKGFRMAPRPAKKRHIEIDGDAIPLSGTAVTVGSIKARVCVAETIEEAANIQPGDILLTYSTDVGWSPYFPLISGIVTEIGGTISHGAVIAREYGIPCLIAVKNVCNEFQTGDIAYLDCKAATIVKVKE